MSPHESDEHRHLWQLSRNLSSAGALALVLGGPGLFYFIQAFCEVLNQSHDVIGIYRPIERLVVPAIWFTSSLAIGFGCMYVSQRIDQRRSRFQCLAVAAIMVLIVPFGTVLGVAILRTLMRPSVIALYPPSEADPD